MNRKSLVIGQG